MSPYLRQSMTQTLYALSSQPVYVTISMTQFNSQSTNVQWNPMHMK